MRDNYWLKQKLDFIWSKHFPEVPRHNEVIIKFGRNASTRLGSIKLNQKSSVSARPSLDGKIKNQNYGKVCCHNSTQITITGYFADEQVPEEVIEVVIAHELAHYAHGFSSPLPQLARYPHHGGLVDAELKNRGFAEKLIFQKKWLKSEWKGIVGPAPKRRRIIRRRKRGSIFQFLISN